MISASMSIKPEVADQRRKLSRECNIEAVRLVRDLTALPRRHGNLAVHENVLRKSVKEFAAATGAEKISLENLVREREPTAASEP